MKQDKQFDSILNDCLDRILRGGTIEECLRDYPDYSRELEPLLRLALATRSSTANIRPRPEFKARARYEFNAALHELQVKKTPRWSFFDPSFVRRTGWAIGIIVVLVIVFGGGSTIVAASNSMPDSLLYPVKLATEQAQLLVTPSNIGKAELNAKFADRRADEIAYMAGKGDAHEVQIIAEHMNANLENMTDLTKNNNNGTDQAATTYSAAEPAGSGEEGNANGSASPPMLGAANPQAQPPVAVAPAPAAGPSSSSLPPAGAPMAPSIPEAAPPPELAVPNVAGPQALTANTPAPSITAKAFHRPAAGNSARNAGTSTNNESKTADKEKLKQIIIDNYNNRQTRLSAALKKASPDVRPAIRQALAKSQLEFEKALKNLDLGDDSGQ